MGEIEEIEPTKSSAGEAAALAYAASLARPNQYANPAGSEAVGGSGPRPDAVMVMGQRDVASERIAQLRAAADSARAQSAALKTRGTSEVGQGEKLEKEGGIETAAAEPQVEAAQAGLRTAQMRERAPIAAVAQADQAEHEQQVVEAEAADGRRRATDLQENAQLVVEIGRSQDSDSTLQQGSVMFHSSADLSDNVQILYRKATDRGTEGRGLRSGVARTREVAHGATLGWLEGVTSAETALAVATGVTSQGNSLHYRGNSDFSDARDMAFRASMFDYQAELIWHISPRAL